MSPMWLRAITIRTCAPIIEAFGLQTVGSTSWGAQRVEELLMNPSQRMVYSAGNGEVEVYEVQHPRGMEWPYAG